MSKYVKRAKVDYVVESSVRRALGQLSRSVKDINKSLDKVEKQVDDLSDQMWALGKELDDQEKAAKERDKAVDAPKAKQVWRLRDSEQEWHGDDVIFGD